MNKEFVYWIALTQIRTWTTEKINQLMIKIIHEHNIELSEFFSLSNDELKTKFDLSEIDVSALESAKQEFPRYSFLIEDLLAQGFEIITMDSPKYSKTLKNNLKIKHSPPVLYVKGNTQLLQENSIAIVGSRDAEPISLQFTDNIAKTASGQFKVIVSGFAKGVDKQALDSALKYNGQSIIVLPQGIMTFGSSINKYYSEIQRGDVLVLSTFFPKAPWSAQLAMARNPIIYGLAKEIYVAQSLDKGGTWAGVVDGLRKGREIYVRTPEINEKNANNLLIEKGAKAVDILGNPIISSLSEEPTVESKIIELLKNAELSSDEIVKKLKLDWKVIKMTNFLKTLSNIIISNTKPKRYTLNTNKSQDTLFYGTELNLALEIKDNSSEYVR